MGQCHLWLYCGVVQPGRQSPLCPALEEGGGGKHRAVPTGRYMFLTTQPQWSYSSWLWPLRASVLQEISKLAADLPLIFTDAGKMATSYWRSRLGTYKSFVSVETEGSRLLILLLCVKGVRCFFFSPKSPTQNLWRLRVWLTTPASPHP